PESCMAHSLATSTRTGKPIRRRWRVCRSPGMSRSKRTLQRAKDGRMDVRFYVDPETGLPHTYHHGVTEDEVLQVLRKPGPIYRGDRNSRLKSAQTQAGRYIQVVYDPDPGGDSVFVITAYTLSGKALK